MLDLTIYVLTRNRKDFLVNTLNSIINQTYREFYLIVSDNSTDDLTQMEIVSFLSIDSISYIKRSGKLTGIEHLNLILSEVSTKYLMMFHDDDIMLPNMIENLYSRLSYDINLVAISCNAYLLKGDAFTMHKIINKKNDFLYITMEQMIQNYMQRKNTPLFPSYMYNMEKLKEERLHFDRGRKYADASFICSLLSKGKILFISRPLFYYRIHLLQDSAVFDSTGCSQMWHYMISQTFLEKRSEEVLSFRLYNMYWNYISNKKVLSYYTFLRLIKLFLRKYQYVLLFKLLIRKIFR